LLEVYNDREEAVGVLDEPTVRELYPLEVAPLHTLQVLPLDLLFVQRSCVLQATSDNAGSHTHNNSEDHLT